MKNIRDLNKKEKIQLLKQIQKKNIHPFEIKKNTFIGEKIGDIWVFMALVGMQPGNERESYSFVFIDEKLQNEFDETWCELNRDVINTKN
ncbi:MAG: hypothetical protein JXA77_01175 [Bacteroidales bacterium]|nr:hypothetical protein [Bacteroidales bacterium]